MLQSSYLAFSHLIMEKYGGMVSRINPLALVFLESGSDPAEREPVSYVTNIHRNIYHTDQYVYHHIVNRYSRNYQNNLYVIRQNALYRDNPNFRQWKTGESQGLTNRPGQPALSHQIQPGSRIHTAVSPLAAPRISGPVIKNGSILYEMAGAGMSLEYRQEFTASRQEEAARELLEEIRKEYRRSDDIRKREASGEKNSLHKVLEEQLGRSLDRAAGLLLRQDQIRKIEQVVRNNPLFDAWEKSSMIHKEPGQQQSGTTEDFLHHTGSRQDMVREFTELVRESVRKAVHQQSFMEQILEEIKDRKEAVLHKTSIHETSIHEAVIHETVLDQYIRFVLKQMDEKYEAKAEIRSAAGHRQLLQETADRVRQQLQQQLEAEVQETGSRQAEARELGITLKKILDSQRELAAEQTRMAQTIYTETEAQKEVFQKESSVQETLQNEDVHKKAFFQKGLSREDFSQIDFDSKISHMEVTDEDTVTFREIHKHEDKSIRHMKYILARHLLRFVSAASRGTSGTLLQQEVYQFLEKNDKAEKLIHRLTELREREAADRPDSRKNLSTGFSEETEILEVLQQLMTEVLVHTDSYKKGKTKYQSQIIGRMRALAVPPAELSFPVLEADAEEKKTGETHGIIQRREVQVIREQDPWQKKRYENIIQRFLSRSERETHIETDRRSLPAGIIFYEKPAQAVRFISKDIVQIQPVAIRPERNREIVQTEPMPAGESPVFQDREADRISGQTGDYSAQVYARQDISNLPELSLQHRPQGIDGEAVIRSEQGTVPGSENQPAGRSGSQAVTEPAGRAGSQTVTGSEIADSSFSRIYESLDTRGEVFIELEIGQKQPPAVLDTVTSMVSGPEIGGLPELSLVYHSQKEKDTETEEKESISDRHLQKESRSKGYSEQEQEEIRTQKLLRRITEQMEERTFLQWIRQEQVTIKELLQREELLQTKELLQRKEILQREEVFPVNEQIRNQAGAAGSTGRELSLAGSEFIYLPLLSGLEAETGISLEVIREVLREKTVPGSFQKGTASSAAGHAPEKSAGHGSGTGVLADRSQGVSRADRSRSQSESLENQIESVREKIHGEIHEKIHGEIREKIHERIDEEIPGRRVVRAIRDKFLEQAAQGEVPGAGSRLDPLEMIFAQQLLLTEAGGAAAATGSGNRQMGSSRAEEVAIEIGEEGGGRRLIHKRIPDFRITGAVLSGIRSHTPSGLQLEILPAAERPHPVQLVHKEESEKRTEHPAGSQERLEEIVEDIVFEKRFVREETRVSEVTEPESSRKTVSVKQQDSWQPEQVEQIVTESVSRQVEKNMDQITRQVYRRIEHQLKQERERRGL